MAESDDDVDQAFLFAERATTRKAITRKPLQLPISDTGWELVQTFALGVQHIMPVDMDPEPVIKGILADGFYMWDEGRLPEPSGRVSE